MADAVDHPKHYNSHPSGVEVITITEHMNFCLGNAVKYIMRAGLKGDAIEDLKKARWYVSRELQRLTGTKEEASELESLRKQLDEARETNEEWRRHNDQRMMEVQEVREFLGAKPNETLKVAMTRLLAITKEV